MRSPDSATPKTAPSAAVSCARTASTAGAGAGAGRPSAMDTSRAWMTAWLSAPTAPPPGGCQLCSARAQCGQQLCLRQRAVPGRHGAGEDREVAARRHHLRAELLGGQPRRHGQVRHHVPNLPPRAERRGGPVLAGPGGQLISEAAVHLRRPALEVAWLVVVLGPDHRELLVVASVEGKTLAGAGSHRSLAGGSAVDPQACPDRQRTVVSRG